MSKGAAKTESSPAPQPRTPEDIRNVVLVGPGGAGKTTLFDHLVAARVPGRRPRRANAHRSVGLAVASFESDGVTINLLDTPGLPRLRGRAPGRPAGRRRGGLRRLGRRRHRRRDRTALAGVRGGRHAPGRRRDASSTSPGPTSTTTVDAVPAGVRGRAGALPARPRRRERSSSGRSGCSASGCSTRRTVARGAGSRRRRGRGDRGPRGPLIESDHRGVRGRRPCSTATSRARRSTPTSVLGDLRSGRSPGHVLPDRPDLPATGVGLEELLEVIEQCFPARPAAASRRPPTARRRHPARGHLRPATARWWPRSSGPRRDPYVGRLSLVRVFSGTLRADDAVHVSGHLGEFVERTAVGRGAHRPRRRRARRPARLTRSTTPPVTPHRGIAGDIVLVSQASPGGDVGHPLGQGPARPGRALGAARPAAAGGDPRRPTSATRTSSAAPCSGSSPRT